MGPAFQQAYDQGVKPLIAGTANPEQAFEKGSEPFRAFMIKNVREKDLGLFMDLSREPRPAAPEGTSLRILVPAFMISELRRAFEIGFLLFVPFLVIDLVIASVLMSMGMMMLTPVVVSLPFKLIFFVLVDGWSLVAGSLVQSYGTRLPGHSACAQLGDFIFGRTDDLQPSMGRGRAGQHRLRLVDRARARLGLQSAGGALVTARMFAAV